MVSVSEEYISGIDTHFRKYRIGGIDTFGIVSPITSYNYHMYVAMYVCMHVCICWRQRTEYFILTSAKLVSPVIEASFAAGFDW